jgi:predicted nucleotidyltransferase
MRTIGEIIRERDAAREAEAAPLAVAALRNLKDAGFPAWLVGSLARASFRQHSDIDVLIDAPPDRRTEALRICLRALRGFPSSIIFKGDLPPHALSAFATEAADGPRFRSHQP